MTAAVAGAAGRAAAGRAGAGAATRAGAARKTLTPQAKAQRANDRRAARFADRYSDPATRAKKTMPPKGRTEPAAPAKPAAPPGGGGSAPSVSFSVPSPVSSGAGFLLAVVFWGWVALPFLQRGPQGVTDMLRAKFVNKARDGSWLP